MARPRGSAPGGRRTLPAAGAPARARQRAQLSWAGERQADCRAVWTSGTAWPGLAEWEGTLGPSQGPPSGQVSSCWPAPPKGNAEKGWMRGVVVDFVHVHGWPVFNAADVYLALGMGLLVASTLSPRSTPRTRASPP